MHATQQKHTGPETASRNSLRPLFGTAAVGLLQGRTTTTVSAGQRHASSFATVESGDAKERALFNATASAKVWTSQVAMHLDRGARDRFFRQIDALHDADEWVGDESPISLESYKTFIRSVVYHKVNSKPGLSLMPNGNVLASWKQGSDKLTIEFVPGNITRWMIHGFVDGQLERAAGITQLERLRAVLQPYNAERWFDGR
jgi:hypothetical protein